MKLYGYAEADRTAPDPQPLHLVEATLVASPDELRTIATFLLSCATAMEKEDGRPPL